MTTTLDFDSQYEEARDSVRFLITDLVDALDAHEHSADDDRNGLGQINYGNIGDLNAAAELLERALARIA